MPDVVPWGYVLPEPPRVAIGYRNKTPTWLRLNSAEKYNFKDYDLITPDE
jgi:hypothetical protein